MRYRRADIVDRAIDALDVHGLADLSMRALSADLGVRASALYHHFDSKAALLAAMAEEILRRGGRPAEVVAWDAEVRLACVELRDAIRAHRDGADLIARVHGAGDFALEERMRSALERAGAEPELARVGARSLVRFVLAAGHDADAEFALALGLLVDGLRHRLTASV